MIDGRRVVWFRIAGGKHHGAIGAAGGATVERAVQLAGQLQVPLVGELDSSGAELGEGVAALHAWGRLARELVSVSGVVPTLLAVTGGAEPPNTLRIASASAASLSGVDVPCALT